MPMVKLAKSGSTATEMGFIGAVVLVATIGMWFFLGDGLRHAFGLVRTDMLTQVSNANGMTLEQLEEKYKTSSSNTGNSGIDPSDNNPPVSTAGSNGTRDHVSTYKALQDLIARSTRKGTLTKAQSDTLQRLTDQILLILDLEDLVFNAEVQAGENPEMVPYMRIQFKGQTYLLTELAAKLDLTWDSDFLLFYWFGFSEDSDDPDDYYMDNSEYASLDKLYIEAEESGLFDDPEVAEFIDKIWWGEV